MDGEPPTVGDALERAHRLGLDRLDAQLIVAARLGRDRAWVIAHPQAALAEPAGVAQWFARRAAGEPLAYLVGRKEFHGLDLCVGPAVLIPRPDTETLVDWALELLEEHRPAGLPMRVADLGTGSGAIALALAAANPGLRVSATDLSQPALEIARGNAQRLGLAIDFRAGDWWAAVSGERFDLVVANPPYIAPFDPHLDALAHEPRLALVSGADGFDAIERIVAGAGSHLNPGAWLLLEHGHDQGPRVAALMQQAGFDVVQARRDLAGIVRCTGGCSRPTDRGNP